MEFKFTKIFVNLKGIGFKSFSVLQHFQLKKSLYFRVQSSKITVWPLSSSLFEKYINYKSVIMAVLSGKVIIVIISCISVVIACSSSKLSTTTTTATTTTTTNGGGTI